LLRLRNPAKVEDRIEGRRHEVAEERFHTVYQLAAKVAEDDQLREEIKANPGRIATLAAPPSDPWVYRMVVAFLGLIALSVLIGAMLLTGDDKTVPDWIQTAATGAGGALVGLLVPYPLQK
jgi:hypothetical protein